MLREFPEARMVGLDGSSQMLAKAGELLAPHGERAALRTFRLEDSSWMEALPPVRVFLSSLVLHHLDGPGKRELFERLLFGLEPGGALLFADLMQPRTEHARRHIATAWEREIGRRSQEIHGDGRARSSSSESSGTSTSIPIRWTYPRRFPSSCAGWRTLASRS